MEIDNLTKSTQMQLNQIQDLRVKFNTNVKDIKISTKLQNQIIKPSQITGNQLERLIYKLVKYDGTRELDIFINNLLIKDKSKLVIDTISLLDISENERLIETGADVFYCFQMEKPKLVDSKKQDEWIKKIINIHNGLYSIALFNTEVKGYNVNDYNMIDQRKVARLEEETTDYSFMNDMCINIKSRNNENDCYSLLAILAIRDNDYLFESKELSFTGKELKALTITNGKYRGDTNKGNNITVLSSCPNDERVFLSGFSNGNVELYRVNIDYEFKTNDKPKKKSKSDTVQALQPVNQMNIQGEEVSSVDWIDNINIVSGSLEYIKLVNIATFSIVSSFVTNTHLVTSLGSISESLVMSSHDNAAIKIWDVKTKFGQIQVINKAHKGYVSKAIKYDEYKIVSSGYDGSIKLWDRRNLNECYFKFPSLYKDKVFDICLHRENDCVKLLSGGESSYLECFEV